MRRRQRETRRLGPAAAAFGVAAAGLMAAGAARATGFDIDFFKPTSTATGYFAEESGRVLGDGAIDVDATLGYMRQPLVLRDQLAGAQQGDIIHERFTTYVIVALGIANRADIGFRAPVVVKQTF